ncbi:MAG: hypothetical protein WAT39_15665 [Planctomycetota bacterium]
MPHAAVAQQRTSFLALWFLLAGIAAWQLCLLVDLFWTGVCGLLAVPAYGVLFRGRTRGEQEPTIRVAIAALCGHAALWIGMVCSTVRYEDLDRLEPEEAWFHRAVWQYQLGDARYAPADDTALVCAAAAGFPIWGVGGSDGHMAQITVPREGFVGPPRLDDSVIAGSFTKPAHLKLDRGLGLLWANWILLTLGCALVACLVPSSALAACYCGGGVLFLLGAVCQALWVSKHCFWW